jgi:DUF4097 and DUF4098 domain-containing protein YvlB
MKSIKLIIVALLLFVVQVEAQEYSETINETLSFPNNSSNNKLFVYNVEGDVKVVGYSGNTVKVEAVKTISGKKGRRLNAGDLALGKQQISLATGADGHIIYVYLDSPYSKFELETGKFSHNESNVRRNYHYTMNILVKVPFATNVKLGAMNNGVIEVTDIDAEEISVNNLNGPITLNNIAGKVNANALNKDIMVSYAKNPTKESHYNALNGDVHLSVQKGLNADVSFRSLNGDIYTNIETSLGTKATRVKTTNGRRGTKYKVNSDSNFIIGNGGVSMHFDLLNGDVLIKE